MRFSLSPALFAAVAAMLVLLLAQTPLPTSAQPAAHVPLCPLTADQLALIPSSVSVEPINIKFQVSFTDTAKVTTKFRANVATAAGNIDASRICIADVKSSALGISASVLVLPDYMSTGSPATSIIRSNLYQQMSSDYAVSSLSTTEVGTYLDPSQTTNSGMGLLMYPCRSTSALEPAGYDCAPTPDEEPASVDESNSDLGWGLAGVSVGVTALATLLFACGYTHYESEAGEKQADRIDAVRDADAAAAADNGGASVSD